MVPAAPAQGYGRAASRAELEAARSLPILWSAWQHASHGSGTRPGTPRLALLAAPPQQQESDALGEVCGIAGAHAVAVTQNPPHRLIACRVAKLCVRIRVAILITEEPDDRIGHVRICGGDGPVMAVSTRTPLTDSVANGMETVANVNNRGEAYTENLVGQRGGRTTPGSSPGQALK